MIGVSENLENSKLFSSEYFCLFLKIPINIWTIWQSDSFLPFEYQTSLILRYCKPSSFSFKCFLLPTNKNRPLHTILYQRRKIKVVLHKTFYLILRSFLYLTSIRKQTFGLLIQALTSILIVILVESRFRYIKTKLVPTLGIVDWFSDWHWNHHHHQHNTEKMEKQHSFLPPSQ